MKKMEKILGISALILLVLLANLLFFFARKSMTGNAIEMYSYTKAICNENACQDYEISCENDNLIYKPPITEKVYFSDDWEDPRSEEDINKEC